MYVVHYAFLHMSTITKLSQDAIQYYKNITSPIGAKGRIQRDIYNMNSTRKCSRVMKGKLKRRAGGLEEKYSGWSARDLRFHCITLVSNKENP